MDPALRKRQRKEKLYNKLHRGFVNTCMGVTFVASVFLGYTIYQYVRYVRPVQTAQNQLTENELLFEGRNIEDTPNIQLSHRRA